MKQASLQNTNSDEYKLMRVQSGHLKTSYSRIKTHLILIVALILLAGSLSAQDNKASVSLTAAIYEEEVSGKLDKAVKLYLNILKKYPNDRKVCAKTLYRLGLVNEKMGKQKADEYFTRLVNTYPDQIEMVALAKAKLTLYNRATAETTLKAQQSFNLAADLFKQSEYNSAITKYEKVINLAPKSQLAQEAQLWIGHCYFKLGKNEQALQSFNSIIKEFPKSTMIPVTELMISQVQQALAEKPKTSTTIVLDDKTILDTASGVRYTRINSWAGKNDIIKSATDIADISPSRKFLLYQNTIVPFDPSDSFTLFDTIIGLRNSRLSPDGTQVAYFIKNGISVIPVSPETGQPTGPAQKLLNKEFQYGFDINWSPDGKKLIFSIVVGNNDISIWQFSINDGLLKRITDPFKYAIYNMIYSKNGANILYERYFVGGGGFNIKMGPISGKSLTLLDSCAGQGKRFILSPDNQWILYHKIEDKKMLYRLADKQEQELITPEEVGDFVSWADDGNKVFFYRPSAEKKDVMKVATVFGGGTFEIETPKVGINVGWSLDSKNIIVLEGTKAGDRSLKIINLNNHDSKTLKGIENIGAFPSLSPDGSKLLTKLLIRKDDARHSNLVVLPISIKDARVTGEPILIYEGFKGYFSDYSWSKDGKKIAVCSSGDVWICNVEGGIPFQLTKTPMVENFPLWSPDGNYISVYIFETNQLQVLKSSDGEIQMTYEKVEGFNWTPDGKEITIAFEDGQIKAVSMDSGKSRKIANWKEITHWTNLFQIEWSPDGKWLAIYGYDGNFKNYLCLLNIADGKITEVAMDVDEDKEFIKWSPDSKWISYYSYAGTYKNRMESILWEADLTEFMKTIKPGTEKGYTTDFDFKTHAIPEGGVAADGTFTDTRDDHVYKYKKIGEQTWMAENLAYLPKVNPNSDTSSVDKRYYVYGYEGSDVIAAKNTENFQKYGVLYNWPAAMNSVISSNAIPSGIQGSCPNGWHVPSDKEWLILEKTLGMSETELAIKTGAWRSSGSVDKKLLSPSVGDDILIGQSGFNALLGGIILRGVSKWLNQAPYFWAATSFNENKAVLRFIIPGRGIHRNPAASISIGQSVRCVKD